MGILFGRTAIYTGINERLSLLYLLSATRLYQLNKCMSSILVLAERFIVCSGCSQHWPVMIVHAENQKASVKTCRRELLVMDHLSSSIENFGESCLQNRQRSFHAPSVAKLLLEPSTDWSLVIRLISCLSVCTSLYCQAIAVRRSSGITTRWCAK